MKKILVATDKPFAKIAVDQIRQIIEESGFQLVLLEKYKSQDDLIKAAGEANAIIIRSDIVDAPVIKAGRDLQIVVRAGAGYDNVDLKEATNHGVVVMNTPGQNANAVAELAMGMMVYMARNLFNGSSGTELKDKTLGLHAYGNVSKNMARIARGFGMRISAFDPFIDPIIIKNDNVTCLADLKELYATCQYVSLHIPANAQTKESVNYELLSLMPKGAVLVNTARKEVINEASLLRIMKERADFRYVSDVEPGCAAELVKDCPGRYYCTPKKMGAQTEEANINAGVAAARQIVSFFKNGDITFKVN
jgi:D-3-phosphoglycerate dehydrogenase